MSITVNLQTHFDESVMYEYFKGNDAALRLDKERQIMLFKNCVNFEINEMFMEYLSRKNSKLAKFTLE